MSRLALQLAVLVFVCLPMFIAAAVLLFPVAIVAVSTGLVAWGDRLAAARDPVLRDALEKARARRNAPGAPATWGMKAAWGLATTGSSLFSRLAAFAGDCSRTYVSVLVWSQQMVMRIFVLLGKPKIVFVVYHVDYNVLSRFISFGGNELFTRAGISRSINPERPWVFPLGLIYAGSELGFGICGLLCPALNYLTRSHLQQLPEAVQEQFPDATVALAGRLPSMMAAAGIAIKEPLVDGLAGTVYAMERTVQSLVERLPRERQCAGPTVAILGGGGYIGSLLVRQLASPSLAASAAAAAAAVAADQGVAAAADGDGGSDVDGGSSSDEGSDDGPAHGADLIVHPTLINRRHHSAQKQAMVAARPAATPAARGCLKIIALDTRYAAPAAEHSNSGGRAGTKVQLAPAWELRPGGAMVLRTADPAAIAMADAVLVITRCGDDVADYVPYAQPGQEWGDDTHPEIGGNLLRQLHAEGVHIHKAMATREPATYFLPPLPGWPMRGTPGCLLMALVTAAVADKRGTSTSASSNSSSSSSSGSSWNDAGKDASGARYCSFSAAADAMGFRATLANHKPYLQ